MATKLKKDLFRFSQASDEHIERVHSQKSGGHLRGSTFKAAGEEEDNDDAAWWALHGQNPNSIELSSP